MAILCGAAKNSLRGTVICNIGKYYYNFTHSIIQVSLQVSGSMLSIHLGDGLLH
jgi:hypothetical protein